MSPYKCSKCDGSEYRVWGKKNPQAYCLACHRESGRRAYAKSATPQWKYNLRERYGLTIQEYEDLFRVQAGRCAICRDIPEGGRRLCVDHNHATGEIRGLLCDSCNIGLSKYRDDPKILDAAIAYIEIHRAALKAVGE